MLQTILRHGVQRSRLVHVGEVSPFPTCLPREEIVAHAVEVRDPRITEVDVPEETRTSVKPRTERLPETQRAPAEPRPEAEAETKAPTPTETPSRPAKPSDKCRRIPRSVPVRSWYPSPRRTDVRPAAIVKGRETPRSIIHPGPSPRTDPDPVAVAVWRPTRCHRRRRPDCAVSWIIFPGPILIEIFGTNHVWIHVAGRSRVVLLPVSRAAPFIKAIRLGSVLNLVLQ